MRKFMFLLLTSMSFLLQDLFAQPATVSYPFAVGNNAVCGGGSGEIHFYNYNSSTQTISNASGGLVNSCVPQLRIGGAANSAQKFTSSMAGVTFNPADHKIYYTWIDQNAKGGTRTYVWSWPIGTCPGTANAKIDTLHSYNAFILGIAFGIDGKAYVIEFTGKPTYKTLLRSINLTTGLMGKADTLALTGGLPISSQESGDVAISPSGQMFFVMDNKLFTPDYTAYKGTGAQITCTYVGAIQATTGSFVGLTYADGATVAAFSGSGCNFLEINPLTAASTVAKKSGTVFSANDLATVVSGIGASKKLVSATPTGVANEYNVVYDIYVQNYGNMDINKVQVTDDLTAINGAGNVTNVATSFVGPVPAGISRNTGFNGNSNKNLLNGTGTLPNYPIANNNFTIRITCTLSNIVKGKIYNNSAVATAIDFNGNNLRDVSTNGDNPDLNGNDKPDDAGEDQPTPLLISISATTPPCAQITNVLFSQNFGTGTTLATSMGTPFTPPGAVSVTASSLYSGKTTQPLPVESFTLTNNAYNANNNEFRKMTDHTGNLNGRMLVVNADAASNIMFRGTFAGLSTCAGQQYSLSFYAAFPGNGDYQTKCAGFGGTKYPKIKMRIRDYISGLIITEISTPAITNMDWQQYGLKFVSPESYSYIIIELVNDAPGGCGNDVVIDDIEFGTCDVLPVINIVSPAIGCIGSISTLTTTLNDPGAIPGDKQYQWQVSSDNIIWTNIAGADARLSSYTFNPFISTNSGKYYRVAVAGFGNMGTERCKYYSPSVFLTAKTPSAEPASVKKSKDKVCPENPVEVSVVGGYLGTNASWKWYAGSCGETLIGTGESITVKPKVTTTYYVRAEGDCNITSCQQVTIYISCDIDKDKDGIPDWVESNMPEAFGDHDGDGIINAYDTDYPGFVDNNGDFINDNFQADGDSDGDGIPNYLDLDFPGRIDVNGDGVDDRFDADLDGIINMLDLDSDNDGIPDVVEAGGVDEDGDGRLDNFVDIDGDGLSDQVDSNLSGPYNSGIGLGLPDFDKDGIPNQFDLDSDNDGIPDVVEVGGPYSVNNGRISGFIDLNKDGISDNLTGAGALLKTGPDTNGDGRADSYPYKNMDKDFRPNPYDLDSDGDGITDVREAGFPDEDNNGIIDGIIGKNGWSETVSSMPVLIIRNSDGDPYPDYLDIDSDNDGIPDNIEGQTTTGYLMPTGIDTDGDGIDDAYDNKPTVFGGMGIYPTDHDGDGIPDYLDEDSDNDGAFDINEGNDWDFNGIADEITTLLNVDTDGDGLDDRFDLDNNSAKGTSSNMGNNGTTNGDPFPGTRAVVQKTDPDQGNRDWRWAAKTLPVNFVHLKGELKNGNRAQLSWSVIASKEIDRFEIYRSTDNINFHQVESIKANIKPEELKSFMVINDLNYITSTVVFYRVHVIGKNEERKLSDVIVIRISNPKSIITVMPNPASGKVTLRLFSQKENNAVIKLIDHTGRTIMNLQQRIHTGTNYIPLNNLEKFSAGVYNIQIITREEIMNTKLTLVR